MAAHELAPGDWCGYGRKDFPHGSWSTDGGLLRARASARPPAFRSGRVFVQGTNMEFWLDGLRVLSCDLADEQLAAAIAVSKFRESPRFAKLPEGHIVLQHHGTEAAFRYLRLETF